jgi:hypothetical protein
MHLKKPSFHRTDFSPSWSHKSDSLPNFGVNTRAVPVPYPPAPSAVPPLPHQSPLACLPSSLKCGLTTSSSVRFQGRSALLDLAIMAATGTMVGLALTSSLGGGEFQVLAHEAMRSTHHAQGPNPPNSCSISPPSWRPCRATERVVRSFPARRHIPVLGCHS